MAGIKSFRISDETKERLELLSASIEAIRIVYLIH